MAFSISPEAAQAIRDKESVKIVATIGREGIPHAAVKDSLTVLDDGTLAFYELLETSQTQKNLVYSIWFNKYVSVTVVTRDGRSYQLKGIPQRAVVAGRRFLEAYEEVQRTLGPEADLSAIWVIRPELEREGTYRVRREEEEALHPYELHVDRIAKEEYR